MLKEEFKLRMQTYLKAEYEAFLASYNDKNIRSLRVNRNYLDSKTFLDICDFKVSPLFKLEDAYLVHDDLKFGFHPLHHAGAFYLQDPSAMLPALTTNLFDGSLILDLCAAPGGKTTELASLNPNGVVFANEIDHKRSLALNSNVERLGLRNVIITNNDSKDYLKAFQGVFDYILVDAPCSGEGMFRKYPESQDLWSLENIQVCHNRDLEILNNASKLLKKGGKLIYSTCTFAKEENEDIITYLEDELNFKLIDINEDLKPYVSLGFKPLTYRVYPHHHFGEGQFMCVLEKLDGEVNELKCLKEKNHLKEYSEFEKASLNTTLDNLLLVNDNLYKLPRLFDLSSLRVINYGVKLGNVKNKRFIPEHQFFKAYGDSFKSSLNLSLSDPLVLKYLHGEEINHEVLKGYGVLKVCNIPLGGYKASNGNLKNYYPKGLRNF